MISYSLVGAATSTETYLQAIILIIVGAYLCVSFGGTAVGWMIRHYLYGGTDDDSGMVGAGRAIGLAERTLIYLFILADAPTAIGLLVAAKSIMRLGDVTKTERDTADQTGADSRARSEYVIFGTLASFAWAATIAYVVRFVITTWLL